MTSEKKLLIQRVEQALHTIRPHLQIDGGDIAVADITPEGTVLVQLLGACQSCPISFMTMKAGVEYAIKSAVPEIKEVRALAVEDIQS